MTASDSPAEELTPKQDSLITLLLAGIDIKAAARNIGIGEKTAHRWLKLPHFLTAYKSAQQSLFDDNLSELRSGVSTAISTLKRNMTGEEVPPSTQVRAAQIWLDSAIELHKMSELEARLMEIEERLKGR